MKTGGNKSSMSRDERGSMNKIKIVRSDAPCMYIHLIHTFNVEKGRGRDKAKFFILAHPSRNDTTVDDSAVCTTRQSTPYKLIVSVIFTTGTFYDE